MPWARNLCRFCGEIGDICYNLFDPNLELPEKVKKCLGIQVSEEDFKPNEICGHCYNKIIDFLQFVDLCISANMKFESLYYGDPYSFTLSDKELFPASIEENNYESNNHKQSVIVSNRQGIDPNLEYPRIKKEAVEILDHCVVAQTEMLEFNINYNNMNPTELNTLFSHNAQQGTKTVLEESIEKVNVQNDKIVLAKHINNDLLVLEDEITKGGVDCSQSKMPTISADFEAKSNIEGTSQGKELLVLEHIYASKVPNSELKKNKSYSCPHCDKIFKRRINLSAHISIHTNIRGFKCANCPKSFAVKCHLTQHTKIHSELFKCHICQKRFQVPSKLLRHIQTHSTNKPFICSFDSCHKAFTDKHNLKQHILCHTAVKNLSCNICGKLFKTRKNLNAHIKSHVSEKLYQCTYCEQNFRYKHNLKTHIGKHCNESSNKRS